MPFKRFFICLLIVLILPSLLFASELSPSFQALYNGVYASVAAYFSVPRVSIDGVSYVTDKSDIKITKISFNRVDLAKLCIALKKNREADNWYKKLYNVATSSLSPMMSEVIRLLDECGYQQGDYILDGTINLNYNQNYPFRNIIDLFVKSDWSDLNFTFNMSIIVSGAEAVPPILFEGLFQVVGEPVQRVTVSCDGLYANGERFDISPLVFKN